MEYRAFSITSPKNKLISIDIIPGHFTTSTSHLTHYLDTSRLKYDALIARDVAREMAVPYLSGSMIDTIVCMEETEVIGAFLAEELLENGGTLVNSDREIRVITPKSNMQGQLIFPRSTERWVYNKHVVLLTAVVASGKSLMQALECLSYYNGLLVGISTIFQAEKVHDISVNSIFTSESIPGYQVYKPDACALCRDGNRLDAVVNHTGYFQL
ncbi:MAG: hypothetical protein FWE32_01005 [Oscillospiraceae bacterium]|nr:hypothetical protein [Oscillospiraceae bacterium]